MRAQSIPLFLLVVLACSPPLAAQEAAVSIGIRTTLHSAILNEDRDLLISTPANYARSRARCPVVYVLDANAHFLQTVADARFLADQGMAPEMIVVGIPSAATRGRDYSPATTTASDLQDNPAGGGAARFRQFMVSELRPFIDGRYRTERYRVIVGWSLGGLFVVNSLLDEPDSFDAYIAISPSLWWNGEGEAAKADRLWGPGAKLKKFLYMTHGREYNGIPKAVQWFTRMLGRKAPAGLDWTFEYLPNDGHSSGPARAIYNGLEKLFDGWSAPEDSGIPTPADLEKRYRALSEKFNFQCRPGEERVNGMGYALLRRKQVAEAVALFEYNVKAYPDSPNVYDSLAEALEAQGKVELALQNVRTACRLAERHKDSRLATFQKHLEALTSKAAGR